MHLPGGDPALGTAGDTDGEESERGLCQVGGYRLRLERRSAALFLCVCKFGKCLHGVRGRAVSESLQRRAQQRRLSPRLHGREQGASHAASRRTVRARHPVDNAPDGGKRQAHCLRCIPTTQSRVRAGGRVRPARQSGLAARRETLISGASHPQGLRLVAKRRGAASSAEMCSRY